MYQQQQQQHYRIEQPWDAALSSKYSYPTESTRLESAIGVGGPVGSGSRGRAPGGGRGRVRGASGAPTPVKSLELHEPNRIGPMETVDDFITNESGNSLLLCVFSILLVFPGSACLLVIGGAFTLDQRLQQRHQWVRPCAIAMLALGVILLVTAGFIFASICRSYRRARRRRLQCSMPVGAANSSCGTAGGGSPYTCIVQL